MRYSKVTRRIWGDAKFKGLTEGAKLLFFRLLTAPESTPIPGVVLVRRSALAEDLGWTVETVSKRFGELLRNGIATVDWDAGLVWLPNAITHNSPENPNMVKGWASTWKELPDSDLIAVIHQGLSAHMETLSEQFRNGFETVPKRLPKPSRNQEQEQEQEQDLKPSSVPLEVRSPKGSPKIGKRIAEDYFPTETTLQQCRLLGHNSPQDLVPAFIDYWIAKTGQSASKLNWDATFRNWVRTDLKNGYGGKRQLQRNGFTPAVEQTILAAMGGNNEF